MIDWDLLFKIISTVGGVLGLALGTPGIILFFLKRKNANKKLEIDENKLTVDQFNAALPAYKDLLDRQEKAAQNAQEATKAALKELATYQEERTKIQRELVALRESKEQQSEELTKTNDKLEKLRALFESYVARVGVPLTAQEQAIFEDTKPVIRRPRRR